MLRYGVIMQDLILVGTLEVVLLAMDCLADDAGVVLILRFGFYGARMHLSDMTFRTTLVQIVKILRALNLLIVLLIAEGLLDGITLVQGYLVYQLVGQGLILARLDALELAALLLGEVVVVICQFLSVNPFNESRLHAVTRGIVSVYGGLPILIMATCLVVDEALLDDLFVY